MFSGVILPMQLMEGYDSSDRLVLGLTIALFLMAVLIMEFQSVVDRLTKQLDEVEKDAKLSGEVTVTPVEEQENYIPEDSDIDLDIELEDDITDEQE